MNKVIADFQKDWNEICRTKLKSIWGDQVDKILDKDISFRYFDSLRRVISENPRRLELAGDFVCPEGCESGWENLARKILNGDSLQPHLSKMHGDLTNNDGLLNDWGVHHLHLGISPDSKDANFVERTGPVVYVMVTEEVVYVIGAYGHRDRARWAESEVVETIHREWPQAIERFKVFGVESEALTAPERTTLRKKNTNSFVSVNDGTVYGPLNGAGVTYSGMSIQSVIRADMAHAEIDEFQNRVESAYQEIVEQLNQCGHRVSGDLNAKLVINDKVMLVQLPDYGLTIQMVEHFKDSQ